jgi:hypothetical protein
MGYFSSLAIDYVPYDHDCSYTPPEKQVLWRLEELQDRLEELRTKKRIYEDRVTFSEANLRYVLPEHFKTTADVEAAIELAITDLKDRYGIHICEEVCEEDVLATYEVTGMQISFLDILSMCAYIPSTSAA